MEACHCADPAWGRLAERWRQAGDFEELGRRYLPLQECKDGWPLVKGTIAALVPDDFNATIPCAAGVLTVLAVCTMSDAALGNSLAAFKKLHLATRDVLVRAARCLDASRWPLTVAEVLENFRSLLLDSHACPWGMPHEDCLRGMKDWRWTTGATGSIPRAVQEVGMRASDRRKKPWVSTKETVLAYAAWMDSGIGEEAQFWKSWLDMQQPAPRSPWLKTRTAEDWIYVDPCVFLYGRPAPVILNVGSGPVTPPPLRCGGRHIPVTSADGLASLYWRLYQNLGLSPPQLPVQCSFEQLDRCFGRGNFDLVHVRNALDHAFDAVEAVWRLLAATRRGGTLLLHHGRNEGVHMRHKGMHLWSFDLEGAETADPQCILKFQDRWRINVNKEFAGTAKIEVRLVKSSELKLSATLEREDYIFVTMTRL